jgi:hypothetical protein
MLFVIFITLKDKNIIVLETSPTPQASFVDPIFKVEGSELNYFFKPKRCIRFSLSKLVCEN